MKKSMMLIGVCFLAGVICACFLGKDIIDAYDFRDLAQSAAALPSMLCSVIYNRAKLFILIGIVSVTRARRMEAAVLKAGFGFALGVFLTACIRNMGAFGFVFFASSLLPHGVFYLLALLIMFAKLRTYTANSRKQKLRGLACVAGISALILLGCFVEALMDCYVVYRALAFISAIS